MNSRCINCQRTIQPNFSWSQLLMCSIFRQNLLPPLADWVCSACLPDIPLPQGERCSLCSRALDVLAEEHVHQYGQRMVCFDCLRWLQWEEQLGIGRIVTHNTSVLAYTPWTEKWMNQYKFRGDERLKYFFASVLVEKGIKKRDIKSIDLVTAIPLSRERLAERGFNQAALVAHLLARHYSMPFVEDLLLRPEQEGEKQSKKNRAQRLTDLLQKFIKNSEQMVDIYNKNILLVDDIYTTGATIHAAAYILREAGAKAVQSVTIAR